MNLSERKSWKSVTCKQSYVFYIKYNFMKEDALTLVEAGVKCFAFPGE